MEKWGYHCLIEYKTLWEKEKLLVTSNFFFSHNVFKSCLLMIRQNECLWSKGFTKAQNIDLGQPEQTAHTDLGSLLFFHISDPMNPFS